MLERNFGNRRLTSKTGNKILLLCAHSERKIGTVADHISAFIDFSKHDIVVIDSRVASRTDFDLSVFDGIVFHYSIVISKENYLTAAFVEKLCAYRGLKILFIQDEFRWVNRTLTVAERLGIKVIFTVLNRDVVRRIYYRPYFDEVRFEHTLTGFVPEALAYLDLPPFKERGIDVSYRARRLPAWCGSFARQKWQIGERFRNDAKAYGLRTDIASSEESRLYGEAWIELLANSRATLGTESGASFVDFTGDVLPAVDAYEAKNPEASFEEVRDRFLEGRDGDIVIHVISPRCFEAACLRTLMILYPGEYSGILKPGRHYVELAEDHSNMAEVVAILRDPDRAGEIIRNAHEEIAKSPRWTFRSFIARFDRIVDESLQQLKFGPPAPSGPYPEAHVKNEIRRVRAIQERYAQRLQWISWRNRVIDATPFAKPIRAGVQAAKRIWRKSVVKFRH